MKAHSRTTGEGSYNKQGVGWRSSTLLYVGAAVYNLQHHCTSQAWPDPKPFGANKEERRFQEQPGWGAIREKGKHFSRRK